MDYKRRFHPLERYGPDGWKPLQLETAEGSTSPRRFIASRRLSLPDCDLLVSRSETDQRARPSKPA